jgi:hypothetical protein
VYSLWAWYGTDVFLVSQIAGRGMRSANNGLQT